MLADALNKVYSGLRLHFYMQVMSRFDQREATLTTVEAFSMEVIHEMGEPTISEFSEMMGISSPNAAVRINSLIRKGYVEKIRSEEDKRTYHLHPTQKFMEYNRINLSYLQTIGDQGNLGPNRITQLLSPVYLNGGQVSLTVTNPVPATGGASPVSLRH